MDSIVQKALAASIVNTIRTCVAREISIVPVGEHDPWNENENGVAWLDNEIGMFEDLFSICDKTFTRTDFESFTCVVSVEAALAARPLSYLVLLQNFVKSGGTNAANVFECRSANNIEQTILFLTQSLSSSVA
jgi:hypothetical protein